MLRKKLFYIKTVQEWFLKFVRVIYVQAVMSSPVLILDKRSKITQKLLSSFTVTVDAVYV